MTLGPKIDWVVSDGGAKLAGTFDGWEIAFIFENATATQPLRVEMRALNQSPAKGNVFLSRTIEFLEWQTVEGVVCPKKVSIWNLELSENRQFETSWTTIALEKVGPVIKISDRYADFFTGVPEGSHVQVNDYLAVDFIWKGGEIVRKIEHVKLNFLTGKSFVASSARRYFLITNGLAILGIVTFLVWRRYRATFA